MTTKAKRQSVADFIAQLQTDDFCIIPAEQFKQILEDNSRHNDLLLECTQKMAATQATTSDALVRIADALETSIDNSTTHSYTLLQKVDSLIEAIGTTNSTMTVNPQFIQDSELNSIVNQIAEKEKQLLRSHTVIKDSRLF